MNGSQPPFTELFETDKTNCKLPMPNSEQEWKERLTYFAVKKPQAPINPGVASGMVLAVVDDPLAA